MLGIQAKLMPKSGSSWDLRDHGNKQTSTEEQSEEAPSRLRRVFTAHAASSRSKRKQRQQQQRGGFCLPAVMREPLRVVHSVPLSFPQNRGTSSGDLISRRGVFSRRHYGSVEQLPQVDSEGQEGRRFRVENGDSLGEKEEMFGSPSTPVLENPEYQTRWYFKYFLGKLHQTYVGCDTEKAPFFLSVVAADVAGKQCTPNLRAILWRRSGSQRIQLPFVPAAKHACTAKHVLSHFANMDKLEKGPKEIFSPEIQKDLLLLEEQEGSVNFKFGVLYAREGQTTDDEMFSNETGSIEFERFVELLGDKVRLKGWDKFRGGLDIKGDMTGRHSVYTIYEGHEIMFHVSTQLPYSRDNRQQVERKRHIGNDIVNIVFVDRLSPQRSFNPSLIRSQFTHVFAVVTPEEGGGYRLAVYSEESVPLFGPSLPCPPVFRDPQQFREFLLVKLINGEKAAFNTPTFSHKRERTLDMLLRDMYSEHMSDHRGTMLNRRAFSDVLSEAPGRGSSARRREEARQVEFVRIGQALKLDTIVRGDAPTSLATTGLFKRAPWEPQCFYPEFGHEVVCGDSWGNARLILATDAGVFIVEDGHTHRPIFDKTVQAKQITVVEAHGILLLRVDKGRDGKIYVFRLSDFETSDVMNEPRGRSDIKEHRLERTRGCHLYATSTRPGASHLRMAAALGRRLLLLQWRHSAAWTAWCPASDTDTVDGFQFLREIHLSDSPLLLTMVDSGPCLPDNQICAGLARGHFEVVSERTGEVRRLPLNAPDTSGATSARQLVAALDLYEDEEPELLLCYNTTCHFQKLNQEDATCCEFDFHWNSVPSAVVCAFPYVLAFTSDCIEIRLVINGSLVHTMTLPKLRLISSKADIFFATTAPEFFTARPDSRLTNQDLSNSSPPASPHSSPEAKPFRLYRIPLAHLSGLVTNSTQCERGLQVNNNPQPGDSPASERAGPVASTLLAVTPNNKGLSRSCSSSPTPAPE